MLGQLLRKMERRRESFYEDTLNIFAREDLKYHWSRAYIYYPTLLPKERDVDDIWILGIAKVGCVP
jgi:hypothetical protein